MGDIHNLYPPDIEYPRQALLFQEGDEKALAFFFQELFPALTFFSFHYVKDQLLAEDIASVAFVKAWKMHHKLNDFSAIRSYLYKIVYRDSIRKLQQEQKRNSVHAQLSIPAIQWDTPFESLLKAELYRQIQKALKELSPAARQVIIMHFLEGKSTGQIARELELHPSTIKTQKARALKILRKGLLRPLLLWLIPFFF